MNNDLINAYISPNILSFIEKLANYPSLPNICNIWKDSDINLDYDYNTQAASIRRIQLAMYLNERIASAKFLLIAEAPGYQGARFSGIPMTSERMLLGHHPCVLPNHIIHSYPLNKNYIINTITNHTNNTNTINNIDDINDTNHKPNTIPINTHTVLDTSIPLRTSCPYLTRLGQYGMNEPTASTVWSHLLQLGMDSRSFVLWNTVAFHTYQTNNLMSNRTPTAHEVANLSSILHDFLALFPQTKIITLGKIAYTTLTHMDISSSAVRHPSMGGANQFRQQISALLI